MERALVYLDESANAKLAASLAGIFVARQQVLTTVMGRTAAADREGDAASSHHVLTRAAGLALAKAASAAEEPGAKPQVSLKELVQTKVLDSEDALLKEVAKGYSIAFVGIEHPISEAERRFETQLQRLVESFDGPVAIALNGGRGAANPDVALNILVPTGGTPEARLATEVALALAKASDGTLTALHVFDPQDDSELLRGRGRRHGMSVLVDARRSGRRSGVPVKGLTVTNSRPEAEIRRATRTGRYDLLVLGTSLRQGEAKFLGPRSWALVRAIRTPVLLIAR
jgi:nucleotide-binding universal stress UspA family protein